MSAQISGAAQRITHNESHPHFGGILHASRCISSGGRGPARRPGRRRAGPERSPWPFSTKQSRPRAAAYLSKHTAATVKAKGTIDVAGGADIVQEISTQLPNKLRDESTITINGMEIKTLTIFDGKKGVLEVNGKKLDLGAKLQDALREAATLLPIATLVPLRDKAYELSVVGEAQVNGKPAVGIRAAKKGQPDVTLYFDKKSYLLAKTEHRTTDFASGQEQTEERLITEYAKDADGRPTPKRLAGQPRRQEVSGSADFSKQSASRSSTTICSSCPSRELPLAALHVQRRKRATPKHGARRAVPPASELCEKRQEFRAGGRCVS